MSINGKNKQMKKYILVNKIFIALQIILVVLSVIFNFIFDDVTVFWVVFAHVVIFVIYNIIVENITTNYLRTKYSELYDKVSYHVRETYIKMCIYKTAKQTHDKVSSTLLIQLLTKCIIIILNILLLTIMVTFE